MLKHVWGTKTSAGNWTGCLKLNFCVFPFDFNREIRMTVDWKPQAEFLCVSAETGLEASGSISPYLRLIVIGKSAETGLEASELISV